MYFLPEDEVKRCTVSPKLENNIKLMRKIELPEIPRQGERFVKYGRDVILFSKDRHSRKISCRKFDHYGIIDKYEGAQLTDSAAIHRTIEVVEALPVVIIGHGFKENNNYKLCLSDVSGNDGQSIEVQDITFDVGCEYYDCIIISKSKYIATFFEVSVSQESDEAVFEGKLCSLLILFEIRLIKDHCYECVEISRIHLEEHIKWLFDVENMIVNETEGKILFQVTKLDYFQTVILLLYDVKTRTIEDNIIAFENSKESFVYFVDHIDFKGGVIIAVSHDGGEIKIYTRNSEMSYVMFKSFPFKFNDEDTPRLYCISNRRNQVLFFQVGENNVAIYDLFDISNKAVLTITTDERPLQLYFNKTGEEIFIYNGRKMYIYLYKSVLHSLILQCASVVAKIYTKSQLIEKKLPKDLYKYF